jgi:putative hydrolase of the HAD superfamily
MKYTDVLLDLDDTLIDTAANTRATVEEVYVDYGIDRYFSSFPEFYAFYYSNVSKLWDSYNKGGITKDEIQKERFAVSLRHLDGVDEGWIQSINEDYIQRIMQKDALVDGAMHLLDYLKPKYRIHILSNGFTEMQYQKMNSAGISQDYFENIILSDIVGVNKPHPDIFKYALDKVGVTSDKVIMIGDNLQTDIAGAYNSGIDQIWFNPENKLSVDIKPLYIVNSLKEIEKIL